MPTTNPNTSPLAAVVSGLTVLSATPVTTASMVSAALEGQLSLVGELGAAMASTLPPCVVSRLPCPRHGPPQWGGRREKKTPLLRPPRGRRTAPRGAPTHP